MSCGCTSSFDGDAITNEMDGFEFHRDNFDGESISNEMDGLEFHRDNFDGEDDNYDNFGGYTNFVDDGEMDNFDNFTKKARKRSQARKDLRKSGLSRKDARKQALEQIPRDKLKDVVAKLKQGISADTSDLSASQADAVNSASVDEVASALPNANTNNAPMVDGDLAIGNETQAGFFAKNKTSVIIGGLAVAAAVGYFVFGKKLGIRK